MTAVGHSRRFWDVRCTSAYPPLATGERTFRIGTRSVRGHAEGHVHADLAAPIKKTGHWAPRFQLKPFAKIWSVRVRTGRQAHGEYRALARFARHRHVAAHHAREFAGDCEPEPG